MYCSHCEKDVSNNFKFCPTCGLHLPASKSTITPSSKPSTRKTKSKIIGIIVAVFLIIIVITGGLLVYSYTQLSINLNDVRFHSIDWESLSWTSLLKLGLNTLSGNWFGAAFDLVQGINLNLIFGISNNGVLPVYIPDLSYDILINNIPVGSGNSNINITIYPGQTKEITSFQNIQKSSLSDVSYSIVSTQGVIDLTVKGTAYFKLFGLSIPIPFESSKQISIYDEIKNKISSEIQNNQQTTSIISSAPKSLGNILNSITNELFDSEDLDLLLSGQTIVDSTYNVNPGSYYYVPFTLPCTANVQGGFIASATLGDNIIVYILDEDGFRQYENGQSISTYYNSDKVESGVFDVILFSGQYYIVMSNTYSDFSTKTVQLQVAAACN